MALGRGPGYAFDGGSPARRADSAGGGRARHGAGSSGDPPEPGGGTLDRRDYILRLIEQAGRALISLRDRILGRGAGAEEVREALRDAATLGGLDYDLARAVTAETLALMVAPGGEVEPGRCWVLAEVFYLDGLEASLDGRAVEAREALRRARFLYGLLRPLAGNLVGIPEADARIEEIEARLDRLAGSSPRRVRAGTRPRRAETRP